MSKNKPTVFIIHGSKGTKDSHWFEWLDAMLIKKGFNVIREQYPTPDGQNLENWLKVLEKHEDKISNDTVFIGHSIAAPFILHYLEQTNKQVFAVYVAGAFLEVSVNEEYDALNESFMKKDFDFKKIKQNCKNFFVFHSEDDPYVPIEIAREYASKIDGQMIEYKDAGHFNDESGYVEFQDLLDLVIKNFNLTKWNLKKKRLSLILKKINIRIRGIYWVSMGENVGFEQNGKNKDFERPVLVMRVFNRNMFLGIPLTSMPKNEKSNYYYATEYNGRKYYYILPQIRLYSTNRILRFIRKIESGEFKAVKNQLRELMHL